MLSACNGVEDDMGEVKADLELSFNGAMDSVPAGIRWRATVSSASGSWRPSRSISTAARGGHGEKALDELSNECDVVSANARHGYAMGCTRDRTARSHSNPQACRQEVIK